MSDLKFFIFTLLIAGGAGYWFFVHQPAQNAGTAPAAPGAVAPQPQPSANPAPVANPSTPSQLVDAGRFSEALKALEAVPETARGADWSSFYLRALDGSGQRQKALELVDAMLKSASATSKPGLLKTRSNLLLDLGDKDGAGDALWQIFEADPYGEAALQAAYKLKELWPPMLSKRDNTEDLMRFNRVLARLVDQAVDESVLEDSYRLLERINAKVFSGPKAVPGLIEFHRVAYGENLSGIAKRYGVAPARIARINELRSRNDIRANQNLRIIRGNLRIVVDKRRFNMDVYIGDLFFRRFPVGIGRGGNTPSVFTTVSRSMARNPPYTFPDGRMVGPDDPTNPIGTRWIGLEMGRGYGVHGTREPNSIGKESSNGCIRMLNENVEEIYDYVMVGDEVEIR